MSRSDNEKMTLGRVISLNARAMRVWVKICPGLLGIWLVEKLVEALSPYFGIYISARLINELAGSREPNELLKWVLIELVGGALIGIVGALIRRARMSRENLIYEGHNLIYMKKLMELDFADVDRQYVFDLYSRIGQGENWNGFGLRKTLREFMNSISAVFRLLGGIGLSVSLFLLPVTDPRFELLNNPIFMVVMILLMPIIAVTAACFEDKGNMYFDGQGDEIMLGNRIFFVYGQVARESRNAPDLRMYGQQEKVASRMFERCNTFYGTNCAMCKNARGPAGLLLSLSGMITGLLNLVIYLFVCLKACGGAFGVGSVTQYISAITQLFGAVSALLRSASMLKLNAGYLVPVFELLDLECRMYKGSLTTEKRSDRKYDIEFRNVSFKYPDTDRWVLKNVNLKFRVGSRLAAVGMNGSGKTTFIKLLCRLYDPTEGEILLNGIDIRKYNLADYLGVFSVVFQDFKLLALSIGMNVACCEDYSPDSVRESLEDAGILERVEEMPHGVDSSLYRNLDPEGIMISGGEAQKLAIARALCKDSPFIILDEPTAALDPIAEAEIYSRFDEITGDKTAIYISHRLSSCKFCDEIIVFDGGSIVERGTHESLLNLGGKYSELWYAQAQYYDNKA